MSDVEFLQALAYMGLSESLETQRNLRKRLPHPKTKRANHPMVRPNGGRQRGSPTGVLLPHAHHTRARLPIRWATHTQL